MLTLRGAEVKRKNRRKHNDRRSDAEKQARTPRPSRNTELELINIPEVDSVEADPVSAGACVVVEDGSPGELVVVCSRDVVLDVVIDGVSKVLAGA